MRTAKTDLSPRRAHSHFVGFVISRLKLFLLSFSVSFSDNRIFCINIKSRDQYTRDASAFAEVS